MVLDGALTISYNSIVNKGRIRNVETNKLKYCNKCDKLYKSLDDIFTHCPICRTKLIIGTKDDISIPKCPTCGSINIQPVSQTRRSLNRWAFGINNPTARAQFECQNCGYKW